MSEFKVQVVRLGPIHPHPNADTLSITKVADYPVILRTGEYKEGDLAVYVPVDAIVPEGATRWSFLGDHTRIRAKRLRGVFSMGLLTPAESGWAEGEDVQERLGIRKFEEEEELHTGGGQNEKDPGFLPVYTAIESLRRWPNVLVPGESVLINEKLHGESCRYLWAKERLWVGSRTCIKKDTATSQWWRAARAFDLESKLATMPDIAFYGEVHGYTKGFAYNVPKGHVGLRFFDTMDLRTRQYESAAQCLERLRVLDLLPVPSLYGGPWDPEDAKARFAEGPSSLDKHVREGFVVRPLVPRTHPELGRVILKYHGEGFLLRK